SLASLGGRSRVRGRPRGRQGVVVDRTLGERRTRPAGLDAGPELAALRAGMVAPAGVCVPDPPRGVRRCFRRVADRPARRLRRLREGRRVPVRIAVSPDGTRTVEWEVATAHPEPTPSGEQPPPAALKGAILRDATGAAPRSLSGHDAGLIGARFSPSGSQILT